MCIIGIHVYISPLFSISLIWVQKEVTEDFASLVQGEISSLGGFDHASGLGYHHQDEFTLNQQIFVEGSEMCQALF